MRIKVILPVVLALIPLLSGSRLQAAGSGSFQLKISQSFQFAGESIGKSGEGDLSFTYQVRRFGMISYLQADRIKQFDAAPGPRSLRASEIDGWEHYIAGPSPGYYVVRSRDGKHYLLHLEKFENQGRAASYWLMTFSWEAVEVR